MAKILAALFLTTFLVACGGGGSSSTSSSNAGSSVPTSTIAGAASNVLTMTVMQGPNPALPNAPFVTVTVCSVGGAHCDTVTNVLVDTASVGLRVMATALPNSLAYLTRVNATTPSTNYLNTCVVFGSGYGWGTVRTADMSMSGESASGVPIQILGDSAAGAVPGDCSNKAATAYSTAAALGANAILGVQGFRQDCGVSCTSTASVTYWSCAAGTACTTESVAPLSAQITNPVSRFVSGNNNGVILEMPAISDSGAVSATGALVFGIGTAGNNALGSAAVVQTDGGFNFTSTYNGSAMNSGAFVDSGSTVFFFDDLSIPQCSGSAYFCPTSTLTRSVVFSSNLSGASSTYSTSVKIANANSTLVSGYYAFNDVGRQQASTMDFGMPLFYGKNVFVKIETATGASNGYLAFISNTN